MSTGKEDAGSEQSWRDCRDRGHSQAFIGTPPTHPPLRVERSLEGRIEFLRIAEVIEAALDQLGSSPLREFETLFEVDREAREIARDAVDETSGP
jgi:hypothetical protein